MDIGSVASREWRSLIEPLLPMGEQFAGRLTDPLDAQLRHELYRELFAHIAAGYFGLLYADPQHPDFWPYYNPAFNYLGANPDIAYHLTPLDDDGVYKISGFRNTVKRVDFHLGTGMFLPRGTIDDQNVGGTTANYDLDSLPIGEDGAFEAVLSPRRPDGYKGNWWELCPKTTCLMVRQVSYDWLNEVDARLAIERLDRPAVKPRPGTTELVANMRQVANWVEASLKVAMDFVQELRQGGLINRLAYKDLSYNAGMITQKYVYGMFDLDFDEALVFESEVPAHCRYWSIHLADDLFVSIDWMNRQSSINGHTARIDKDGKFRAVISEQDPGVPNWLDTAGYVTGGIQNRWEKCSSWPEPKVTKVKTTEVRQHLPADTPVVSVGEREASIRLRRKAVQMRRRW